MNSIKKDAFEAEVQKVGRIQKDRHRRSVETLDLSGHDDIVITADGSTCCQYTTFIS